VDEALKKFDKTKNRAEALVDGAFEWETRAGAVYWGILLFGLTGPEMESLIDGGTEAIPADRVRYAREHYDKTVAKMERKKA